MNADEVPDEGEETLPSTVQGGVVSNLADDLGLERGLVLQDLLGRGGSGLVRCAEQRALRRGVAVKTPLSRDPTDLACLLGEAWITAALDHPNILPIYDLEVRDGVPHVVMKRVEGTSWRAVMHDADALRERFGVTDPLAWNLGVLGDVCKALSCAHARGILHRDVKPSNVMIGAHGEVWLLDWGLAVSLRDEDRGWAPLAREQTRVHGTPAYMAPEMTTGDGAALGVWSDVWLLGATLYHVVRGRPPYRGSGAGVLAKAHAGEVPIDPHWPLADLLRRSLSRDPCARPPSAEAFRRELMAWSASRGAVQLAANASERFGVLTALLEAGTPDRGALYDAFGACRVGWEEALSIRPDLEDARKGLRRATLALARWELSQGDDRAASLLVDRVEDAPKDLRDAIAQARARREQSMEMLDAFERDHDNRRGGLARTALMVMVGSVWVLTPVTTMVLGLEHGYLREQAVAIPTFVLTAAILLVLAPWLPGSRLNRTLVALVVMGPGLASLLNVGGWLWGVPSTLTGTVELFLNFVLALIGSVLVDGRLLPGAAAMLVAFWVAMAGQGEHTLLLMNAANVVLVVNALVIWAPFSPWLRPSSAG